MENETEHEFWLRDTWHMIKRCANSAIRGRVTLTKEGCKAVMDEKAELERDAARYRLMREHVTPFDLWSSMHKCGRLNEEWRDLPKEQTIVGKIDELCDTVLKKEAAHG